MEKFTTDDMFALNGVLSPIADTLAVSMSEALNQMVNCDPPSIRVVPVSEVMEEKAPSILTTFTLQPLSAEIMQIALNEEAASTVAALLSGEDGSEPVSPLLDEHMALMATAFAGIANGLANAVGNLLNTDVHVEDSATIHGPLSLPPSFATEDEAVLVDIPFSIDEVLNSNLTLYFTPVLARAITPAKAEAVESPINFGGDTAGSAFGGFEPMAARTPDPGDTLPRNLDMVLDIPLEATVELGHKRMPIRDVLGLSSGSIVELDRIAGEPVDMLVNGKLLARGEVVVIDDNFGIRITEIVSPAERLAGLAGR